jgi:preprotein translocase subunit SecA
VEFGTQFTEVVEYPSFDWFQRDIMLRILDSQWKDHLHTMDGLRESVGLRGYAQRDPKLEYQREGFGFFAEMEQRVDEQALETIFKFDFPRPRLESTAAAAKPAGGGRSLPGAQSGAQSSGDAGAKVGRNEPCPCGSGKKYKRCHGA